MDLGNFYIAFFFIIFIQPLKAQNEVEKADTSNLYLLSDVVVTATKTETPEFQVANSISVIDSAEIADKNKFSVANLLQSNYGVSVTHQGAPGGLTYVSIRGGNSEHTLVLIDGVEVNMPSDPGNTYDFANLPVDAVKRIEILRGPQSTLYGSDALAGVINIITKGGSGKPKFFLSTLGGSYNTYKILGGLKGGIGMFNYSFTGSKFKTDGYSSASSKYGNHEKDGKASYNLSSKVGVNITKNFDLNFLYRFTESDADYDQFGGKFGDDPTFVFNLEESVFRTEADFSFFDDKWKHKLGVSYFRNVRKYSYDSTLNNRSASRSFYDGRKIKFDWQNNFILSDNINFVFGLETEEEKAASEYYIFSSAFPFTSILPWNSSRTTGIYLQNQFKVQNSLFGTVGIRYDAHERFGSQFTYRISPAYIFWQTGTKVKAAIGTGFKAPSLYYLYDPAFGNINLKPVESFGWDFGIEQYFFANKIVIGLTYFSNDFTNLFGFDKNFKAININEAETNGLEFYSSIKTLKDLEINLGYTFTNSENKNPNSTDNGLALLRRPENKAYLNINYDFTDKLNTNLEIIYVGERDDKDFSVFPAKRISLGSYTLFNFSASYNVFEALELFGRIDNLFDADYEEALGYGTAGFSAYAGASLNL